MQNNIQQPLFASAGQATAGQATQAVDDFDFNAVFAEYFINEFDDPMNAYTSSMANYGGSASALASLQAPEQNNSNSQVTLPTGGIKTAFHTGSTTAPPAKKPKQEEAVQPAMTTSVPVPLGITLQNIPAGVPAPNPLAAAPGQLMHPGMPGAVLSAPMQQQQQLGADATANPAMGNAMANRVNLPIGVGIRLGGAGGIAPAQTAGRVAGVQDQYAVWGAGTGAMSEQAVAERRQRNREHAKRSRVRKKFMLESLQEQVRELQRENQRLRLLVQEHIPEHGMQIIAECCQSNPLFADTTSEDGATSSDQKASEDADGNLVRSDFALISSITVGQQCFVLSDPKLPDNPIVFASPGFYKLTGYTSKEVLGRNCRFLQGPGTDSKAVDVIRQAVRTGSDATVCLLNYKADGSPFWNQFFLAALRDSDNCIVNYVGVQTEVEPEAGTSSLEDKVNAVLPLQNKEE